MDPEQKFRLKWLAFLSIFVLVVVAILPRPAAALPPRPEGERDSLQPGSDGHGDGAGAGAFIELDIRPARPDAWAVVQWLDSKGNWIDVEGWSGAVEENRPVLWWVNEADFGKGPFRWAVYTGSSPTQVLASAEFYLPRQVGEKLPVRITVLPTPTPSPSPTATPAAGVESVLAVTAMGTQPLPSAFTPTPQATSVLMFSATPAPGPTVTPVLTPSPGPSPAFPPAPSNPSTVEVVPSAFVEGVRDKEERDRGLLSQATIAGKGVWASAILVFGALVLAAVRRVRRRRQNRRREQVA